MANKLAFTVYFLLVTHTLAVRQRRANYGEFCDNRAIRCDSSLSLTCKDQVCVCLKPENMIYDSTRKSCASLAGEKCKFTVMEEYRSWQEEISCVSNAHCDFVQSICVCDKDYIELSNGTCIPKKNHQENCETSSDCMQDVSLICRDQKCVCNPSTSEYSEELKQCVGLANEPCVNDLCTVNAICREEPRRVYYGGTSVEIEVSSDEDYSEVLRDPASVGRCQCRTAFGVTSGGKCLLGYGGKCDHEQAKCMDWLKCKEGTCVCQYPRHQVYDKSIESCLSFVGGPCDPVNGTEAATTGESKAKAKMMCIAGAICSKLEGSPRYQCHCPDGYIENRERTCDLDYGQKCKTQQMSPYSTRQASSAPPSATTNSKCDRIGNLFCIDGRCQCEDELHIYDIESRSCKGLVGAVCDMKNLDDCVPEAHCKGRRGSDVGEGVCTCQEPSKELDNGTCTPPVIPPQGQDDQKTGSSRSITLKSGGIHNRGPFRGNFNTTKNTIWTFFDNNEEDR